MDEATKNGGRPAFQPSNGDTRRFGLTKREYFAAMAMQGMLAGPMQKDTSLSAYAEQAVNLSDALLRALSAPSATDKQGDAT